MINFVLTIILEMIAKNNIDIFSKESLFSNTSLVTLLEFSMSLFILWLIIMIVVQDFRFYSFIYSQPDHQRYVRYEKTDSEIYESQNSQDGDLYG